MRNAVQLRKHFYQATRLVAGLLVVAFAMTGAAKLADQIVTWLAFAVWRPFTVADALRFWSIPVPHAPEILGLQQVTEAVLSWPGIPMYLLLAGVCLFLFARIDRALGKMSRGTASAYSDRFHSSSTHSRTIGNPDGTCRYRDKFAGPALSRGRAAENGK